MAADIDSVADTGDPVVDGLLCGKAWQLGADRILSYSFASASASWDGYAAGNEPDDGFVALDDSLREAVHWALAQWSAVANIHFVEVDEATGEVGTLRIGMTTHDVSPSVLGYTYPPYSDSPQSGDVWLNANLLDSTFADTTPGSLGAFTILHELGHALGLKHPHASTPYNDALIADSNDYLANSVMSYYAWPEISLTKSNTNRFPTTPMAYDIAAMQALYGINTGDDGSNGHGGNDNYAFDGDGHYFCTLYDTGGTDTISISGTRDVQLDLTPGTWNALGVPMQIDGVSHDIPETVYIDKASWIDNAYGGDGNDSLRGNSLGNALSGGQGNDVLLGGAGSDTLTGGSGKDTLTGGLGADFFVVCQALKGQYVKITDFTPVDTLEIDTSVLTKLNACTADNFVRGHARDADDYLIYRADLRSLYYDADGSDSTYKAVKVAILHGAAAKHFGFDDLSFL